MSAQPASKKKKFVRPPIDVSILGRRVAISVAEFVQISGVSRPTCYRRILDGSIPTTKIGNLRKVPTWYVNQLFGKPDAAA